MGNECCSLSKLYLICCRLYIMSNGFLLQIMQSLITRPGLKLNHWQGQYDSYHGIWRIADPINCIDCRQQGTTKKQANHLLQRLGAGLESFANMDELFPACCGTMESQFSSWHKSIKENIQKVPMFNESTTLSQRHVTAFLLLLTFSSSIFWKCSPCISFQNKDLQPTVFIPCKCSIQVKISRLII